MRINTKTFARALTGLALAALLLSAFGAMPVAAQTQRYVATTGTDTGDCTDSTNPCLTIGYAIGQAVDGDTINVAAGTYEVSVQIVVDKSLTLSGDSRDDTLVRFDPSLSTAMRVEADDVTIEKLHLQSQASSTSGDTYVIDIPIKAWGPDPSIPEEFYRNFTLFDATIEGGRRSLWIHMENLTVENTEFMYDGNRQAMQLRALEGTTRIVNNSFSGGANSRAAIIFEGWPCSGDIDISGNTVARFSQFTLLNMGNMPEQTDLVITGNAICHLDRSGSSIIFVAPVDFTKYDSILIEDNTIFNSNAGRLAVYVDYRWGGDGVAAAEQIQVRNNQWLVAKPWGSTDDTVHSDAPVGFSENAPAGMTLDAFALHNNTTVSMVEVWVDKSWAGSIPCEQLEPGKWFGVNAFGVIQDGLDAAAEDGTVNVAPGTYVESPDFGDTSGLTVNGPFAGVSGCDASRGSGEAIIQGTVTGSTSNALDYLHFDGFWIESGASTGIGGVRLQDGGIYNNVILGSWVDGNTPNNRGISTESSSPVVPQNWTLQGNRVEGYRYGISLDGNVQLQTAHVLENCVSECQRGIQTFGSIHDGDPDFLIEGNHIEDNERGMRLAGGKLTVTGNTIKDNDQYGIDAGAGGVSLSGLQITENTIEGNDDGVIVGAGDDVDDVVVSYNNIVGNTTQGVRNDTGEELDATCNWWGDPCGPGPVGPGEGDNVSEDVDFTPWSPFADPEEGKCVDYCPGNLNVVKQLDGDAECEVWSFAVEGPDVDEAFPLGDGETWKSGMVQPGTYTITETETCGCTVTFEVDSINGGTGPEAVVELDEGESITVTFTNSDCLPPKPVGGMTTPINLLPLLVPLAGLVLLGLAGSAAFVWRRSTNQ